MYAYELLPRLIFLTLTVEDGKPEFWGTTQQWNKVYKMEQQLCQ